MKERERVGEKERVRKRKKERELRKFKREKIIKEKRNTEREIWLLKNLLHIIRIGLNLMSFSVVHIFDKIFIKKNRFKYFLNKYCKNHTNIES